MTDTARSVNDIKALFADNNTEQISPQDMRDYVESVANPVSGGGFPESASSRAPNCNGNWQRWAGGGIQSIPSGSTVTPANVGTPDLIFDPSGRFETGEYVSAATNATWSALSWCILPQGVWQLTFITTWPAGDYYRSTDAWLLDDYMTDYDGYIATYGTSTPFSPVTAITTGQATTVTSVCIVVPPEGAYRVGYGLTQLSGSPKTVSFLEFAVQLIGA